MPNHFNRFLYRNKYGGVPATDIEPQFLSPTSHWRCYFIFPLQQQILVKLWTDIKAGIGPLHILFISAHVNNHSSQLQRVTVSGKKTPKYILGREREGEGSGQVVLFYSAWTVDQIALFC